jgi:hypothetical protein
MYYYAINSFGFLDAANRSIIAKINKMTNGE